MSKREEREKIVYIVCKYFGNNLSLYFNKFLFSLFQHKAISENKTNKQIMQKKF